MNFTSLALLVLTSTLATSLSLAEPSNLKIKIVDEDNSAFIDGHYNALLETSGGQPTVMSVTRKFVDAYNAERVAAVDKAHQIRVKFNEEGPMLIGVQGLEQKTVTKENGDILYYGWCAKVNGAELQKPASETPIRESTNSIIWYYGSVLYDAASKTTTKGCKTDWRRAQDERRRDFGALPSSVPRPTSIMLSNPQN